jgi:hypothetical protein
MASARSWRVCASASARKVLARRARKVPGVIDADWLRAVCLVAGADDVAFASADNHDLASEREYVDAALPGTASYISLGSDEPGRPRNALGEP